MSIYNRSIRATDYAAELERRRRLQEMEQREANRFKTAQQVSAAPPPPGQTIDWAGIRNWLDAISNAARQESERREAERERQRQIDALRARTVAEASRMRSEAAMQKAAARSRDLQARSNATNFLKAGLNPAKQAVARSRMAAAEVTRRNQKDDSLWGRFKRAPGMSGAGNVALKALKVADTGRRAVTAGAMELGDGLEVLAGRENADIHTGAGGRKTRDTGFSWEDFKRNTLDDDTNIGFGDIFQSGLDQTGFDDGTPLNNKWVKRVVGFAGDVALDPLTHIPFGVAASGASRPTLKAGTKAMKKGADVIPEGVRRAQANIARDQFLKNTRRGRALEQEVRRVAASSTNTTEAIRRMPGLAPSTARSIAGAPTREMAQDLASRALRTGEYVPDISIRRQALVAVTGRGLRAPGGLGLGRRVIRESEGLFDIGTRARRIANAAPGRVAVTRTSTAAQARRGAVKASLLRAGVRSGDAREVVARAAVGMSPWDRVNRALIDIESSPGIVADVVESTLEGILPKAQRPADFNRKMAELVDDDEAMKALLEAETLIAVARGDFGDDVAKQVVTELGVGYSRPGDIDALKLIKRAANRSGLALPKPKHRSVTEASLKKVAKEIEKVSDDALKTELRGALSQVPKGKKGAASLNRVAHSAAIAANDEVAEDAANMLLRYGATLAGRDELVGGARLGLGQKVNPARRLGQVVTSLNETIAHRQLRFLSTENAELAIEERVKAFDSYLGALGAEDGLRNWARQGAADIQSEADLYRLVDNSLASLADAEGVSPEILSSLLQKFQNEARDMGFKAGKNGDLIDEVQNLSQLSESVVLPDPVDVKRTIREMKKAADDPAQLAEIRRFLTEGTDTRRIANGFAWLHRTWKLLVVTNLYMPVVGGYVGFVGTEGDFGDKLKGGFQWAAVGALAPSRYVMRIAGIEESARRLLLRGFVPTEFIPGIAKWRATRGVDRPLMSAHLLSSGDPTGTWMRNELAQRTTGEYTALALPSRDGVFAKLGRKDARYVDSWWRIINHEINDANGALDRILLGLRAGHITRNEADKLFKAFIDSEDGKLWWRRWKTAHGAPRNVQEAFERQFRFIEDYVPADIAAVRLPAMDADFQKVPHGLLKGSIKSGDAPAFIHAEKTWSLPRAKTWFRDIGAIKDQLTDKLIFGGPTRALQRRPLTRAIYKDEYTALINSGVAPKRAQELADRHAINITNEVMFNQNNESRFAQKVDIVFPFQQPREELVRVWAPLMFNNKIRTIQLTSLGARALEAGVSNGTFYEYTNPFTGEKEWRAKIPGSATLSRALGGVNAQFEFSLQDLFFLAQDNVGSTLGVPSPGGPFYSVLTRSFVNAFPEAYGNLPDAVKDYLFPFGVSGELMRNEPNRLWMGMMGTPPPWEFASEFEQRNEYNKVQIHMFLHLRYDHFQKTGVWKDPTDEEVAQATKAFFQTQAMMGAVWPAPSRYIQPWQELVEKAKVDYVDDKGEFDYYSFINDHPNMAPFMTARGEYIGPDDLKHWSRSDEERAEDSVKRWERTRTLKDFREEIVKNRLTAEAWEERSLIPFTYPDWEADEAYIRWEEKWLEKLPDVVDQSRSNYFRDRDLNHIRHMAEGPAKDRALNNWRKRYDVSHSSYGYHLQRLEKEGFTINYWKYSRPTDTVTSEVRSLIRQKGVSEDAAVSGLQPAEQFKYWRAMQAELTFYEGEDDPQGLLDRYYLYANRISDLYKKYPKLSSSDDSKKTRIERYIDSWRGDVYSQIDALYQEIDVVGARFDELQAAGKGWSAEGQALYNKRSDLFDFIKALKNKQFKELPGIMEFFDDMIAVTALMRDGKPTRKSMLAFQALMTKPLGRGGYIPSNEERTVLNMPTEVREAYTQKLVDQLSLPAVKGTKGKLYWEWLTDFQQDWLQRNLPAEMVREFKGVSADDAADKPGSGGKRGFYGSGRGYRRYNFRRYNQDSKSIELSWAYEQFKQYTKRPVGAKPPAAYEEYLKLPANPAIRNQFLKNHPEVGEWIASGPMANMPEHLRFIIQNIMVKYGRWEGEIVPDSEINDLAFAREQLKRWNLRGSLTRPEAYDLWMQMPSGEAKAQFMRDHPEIEEWLKLGPMSNMPDAYRNVVRDIMLRYGQWSQETDGLGLVISEYYKQPPYAREKFLEQHPELVAYWGAIRSDEEKRMAAIVDQYFSLKDPNARQAFLIVHPQLRDYFVESRTKRYENFMTQVAIYMGGNPDMFERYLERQEDVLNDLMLRYATPPLLREVQPLKDAPASKRQRIRN